MIKDIRNAYEYLYDAITYALSEFDEEISEFEGNEITSIKDVDFFVRRLKNENLYNDELDKFIDNYLKFYNN